MTTNERETLPGNLPVGTDFALLPDSRHHGVLTSEAASLVVMLEREFGARRRELLRSRVARQAEFNTGHLPNFLPETRNIRESYWRVKAAPRELLDRRVELTGPANQRAIVEGLGSGADVFIADLENTCVPSWTNVIEGQRCLRDAVDGSLEIPEQSRTSSDGGRARPVLMLLPRGLHQVESHLLVDKQPISATLFDVGLFAFHNARRMIDNGSGPYLYIPKLENQAEALLWNEILQMTEDMLAIPRGSIRVSILIETFTASFEMNEILHALRDRALGMSCGRWEYVFNIIKRLHRHREYVMPDRARISMMSRFMRSYSLLLIQTCHKRGAHAIGGLTPYLPVPDNPERNAEHLMKVRLDKEREVEDGHDGSWVSTPEFVGLVRQVFDDRMTGPNQLHRKRDDVRIDREDLIEVPRGDVTYEGVRKNVSVALSYLWNWLAGVGRLISDHQMEDTSTVELSRAQLWQWLHHGGVRLTDGRQVSTTMMRSLMAEEFSRLRVLTSVGSAERERLDVAFSILWKLVFESSFAEFFTLEAYDHLGKTAVSE